VHAATALLDFIYLASLPIHTNTSILALDHALERFHQDKSVFIKQGGRKLDHFDLNKLHALMHYPESIRLQGSLDGYNTKWSERLHIDFAKKGYRASNHINHTPQMATWLTCCEKVVFYRRYLEFVHTIPLQASRDPGILDKEVACASPNNSNKDGEMDHSALDPGESVVHTELVKYVVARTPTHPACDVSKMRTLFGCHYFVESVQDFLCTQSLTHALSDGNVFDVYTRVNIRPPPPLRICMQPQPHKAIRASPSITSGEEGSVFDAVLVRRPDRTDYDEGKGTPV
jgi:hypothetical protein